MMRHKAVYPMMMGVILSACMAATASNPPSTTQATSSGGPTTFMAATTATTSSPATVAPTPNDAVEIRSSTSRNDLLDPGEYWIDHDADPATSLRIQFTVADPGWGPLIGVNKQAGESFADNYVAAHFFRIDQVAKAACDGTEYELAGDTAEAVATQLAEIKDFETLEPLSSVNAFGYDGYHVRLAVQQDGFEYDTFTGCDDQHFDSWKGPNFSRRYYQGPGQVVEFWVLDVEGTLLSIEATWFPDSPEEDLAQLRAIIDSVVITP